MKKSDIIKKIKAIVQEYGHFNTAEVQAVSSPCIASLGRNTCQLAESFLSDKVEAVIYVDEDEQETDYILYEDLKLNILKEILVLAKQYKEQEKEWV